MVLDELPRRAKIEGLSCYLIVRSESAVGGKCNRTVGTGLVWHADDMQHAAPLGTHGEIGSCGMLRPPAGELAVLAP
jgi:hypothetical protein